MRIFGNIMNVVFCSYTLARKGSPTSSPSPLYEVAKSLGLQYRRAHDHAASLLKEGKIRAVETIERGHRKMKLFPTYASQESISIPAFSPSRRRRLFQASR